MLGVKPRLYLETTVPSYLTAWPSRELIVAGHQQVTREWWSSRKEAFEIYVSQFVLDEAGAGDPDVAGARLEVIDGLELLEITDGVTELAEVLVTSGVVPAKAATDAAHIAIAAVHSMDYLMTWNCAHIANATMAKAIRKACEDRGFQCPVICTPEELLEE